MGRSLEARLNGQEKEFLKDVETFGDWGALRMWSERLDGYHSYIGLRDFIEDKTHNPNFGLGNKFNKGADGDVVEQFVHALRKLVIENNELKKENQYLKSQVNIKVAQDRMILVSALEELKV